jgi:hypothetical protein
LAVDGRTPTLAIYREWLRDAHMLRADATAAEIDEAAAWVERLLGRSWEIVRRALFVNDCVFSDSSNYPVSLDHAWWLAEVKNSLKDWDSGKVDALASTEDNVRRLLAEKDEALRLVQAIVPLANQSQTALTPSAHDDLEARMAVFEMYVAGWRAVGRACIITRYLLDHDDDDSPFTQNTRDSVEAELRELLVHADRFRAAEAVGDAHFTTYNLLGWERLQTLHDNLRGRLALQPRP